MKSRKIVNETKKYYNKHFEEGITIDGGTLLLAHCIIDKGIFLNSGKLVLANCVVVGRVVVKDGMILYAYNTTFLDNNLTPASIEGKYKGSCEYSQPKIQQELPKDIITKKELEQSTYKIKPISEGGTGKTNALDAVKALFSYNGIKEPIEFPIVHKDGASLISADRVGQLFKIDLPKVFPFCKVIQEEHQIQVCYCPVWNWGHISKVIVPYLHSLALVTGEAFGLFYREDVDSIIFMGYRDNAFQVTKIHSNNTEKICYNEL